MMLVSPLRQRLAFLLLVLSFVWLCPGLVQAIDDIPAADLYGRAELTDADYEPERIEELTRKLDDKLEVVRLPAFQSLAMLGPEARPALERMIDALDEESIWFEPETLPEAAAAALAALGADAVDRLLERFPEEPVETKLMIAETFRLMHESPDRLMPLLRDEYLAADQEHRLKFLEKIVSVDPNGETAIPLLLKALQNQDDEKERWFAALWLSRRSVGLDFLENSSRAADWFNQGQHNAKPVVDQLLDRLGDEDPQVYREAAFSLSSYPEHEDRIVSALLGVLYVAASTRDGNTGTVAVKALACFPKSAELTVPAIVRWTETKDDDAPNYPYSVRSISTEGALEKLVPCTEKPLQHVTNLLESRDPDRAWIVLAHMGEQVRPLMSKIETLEEPRQFAQYRLRTAVILGCIDRERQNEALKMFHHEASTELDDNEEGWVWIFDFLEQVGANAAFTAPLVEKQFLQFPVEESEGKYGNWAQIHALRFLVKTDYRTPELREAVLNLLVKDDFYRDELEKDLVEHFPGIIPDLIAQLENSATPTSKRVACLRILAAAHAENPELVPLIVAQLQSDHPAIREAAVQALGEIGTKNEQSVKALIKALRDPRVRVRAKALESLAKFGDKAQPSVPQIIKCLSDDYLTVRVAAVRCLGNLGPAAAPAVGDLEKLKDVDSLLLRETAAEAIAKIRS